MIFTLVFVLTYQKYGSKRYKQSSSRNVNVISLLAYTLSLSLSLSFRFIKLLGWVFAILQSLLIIASRKHYTVDVVVAWYTVNLVVFFLDKKLPGLILLLPILLSEEVPRF